MILLSIGTKGVFGVKYLQKSLGLELIPYSLLELIFRGGFNLCENAK
jgi:hypothetical protein